MFDILRSDDKYDYLSQSALAELQQLRTELSGLRSNLSPSYRPILEKSNKGGSALVWYSFAGSKIYETLYLYLEHVYGLDINRMGKSTGIEEEQSPRTEQSGGIRAALNELSANGIDKNRLRDLLRALMETGEEPVHEKKFAELLPLDLRVEQAISNDFDIDGANAFLKAMAGS